MPNLDANLEINRCPHCSIANPNLRSAAQLESNSHSGSLPRKWRIYICNSCGGAVSAWALNFGMPVVEYFPSSTEVDSEVPDRPRAFLQQANESLHAPAGAVMLCASSVDAMLKIKNYTDGSLYSRIEKAAADHLITPEMAAWAHEVRLDANDQRHADQSSNLPSQQDANRAIEFTNALAQFLFILPARVQRGLNANG